jgi:hypothetical protein
MKKLLLASSVALFVLASCGGETVYVVAETQAPATTEKVTTTTKPLQTTPPLATRPPSNVPTYNGGYSPESYDNFLWESVNDFWWLFTTDQLLQMGLLVCEEFDRGSTLEDVNYSLLNIMSDTNTLYLMEGLAAVVAGAVVFLCPEHEWWLSTI